jgi:YebC/PmpR family DNA-binding regulatory protein
MAGHSKWANIKHKKAKTDKKNAKFFTKLIREVQVAAQMGGGDESANPRLRLAVTKALAGNMPRNTIERAIKRGAGNAESDQLVEIRYEGYGPYAVAMMIECLTDNKNRSVAEVRHALTKAGGNLGSDGSVNYLFRKIGVLTFAPDCNENKIMEAALEAGAEDVCTNEDGSVDVTTSPEQFEAVKAGIEGAGLIPEAAEITVTASVEVELRGEQSEKMLSLIDRLEDLDDVQNVYHNATFPDDSIADSN